MFSRKFSFTCNLHGNTLKEMLSDWYIEENLKNIYNQKYRVKAEYDNNSLLVQKMGPNAVNTLYFNLKYNNHNKKIIGNVTLDVIAYIYLPLGPMLFAFMAYKDIEYSASYLAPVVYCALYCCVCNYREQWKKANHNGTTKAVFFFFFFFFFAQIGQAPRS